MRLRLILLVALMVAGCTALPPAPAGHQSVEHVPIAFQDDSPGAYIVVYKGDIGAFVDNRVRVNDGPYVIVGSNACVIWKVLPGTYAVEYDFWAGNEKTKVRLADGDRALLEVIGTAGIVGRSMLVQGDKVSKLRLDGYFDLSRQ